jgi:ATP-dependent RNA helicase DDX56/DBP9
MAKDGQSKERKRSTAERSNETAAAETTPSFEFFRLDPRLLKAVSNHFEKPTLVQAAAIPLALNGKDIVARAKTGSGKTAAYVLPVIHKILTDSVSSSVANLFLR